ncbi:MULTISPECIES: STAS domain-containing protein [Deefgea]|uniref:STAS domain-containing protein n=1 Tax=Deefgea piscis TaxID=2739061 RepID=A0A6M8SLH8_9NEIS|nr:MULTISPECIES: STAS domain-containing protein [Deefgea]MBM5573496.1 STAS domain-containing protein [Deefgea sp. CFH1-16]QKJ65521.1 STAS domain-containing protein [Deefgea piscis]QZA80505.1 STAS domain-containing protein [Deefgea piscis]
MQVNVRFDNNRAILALNGNFTFEFHREFKHATTSALQHPGLSDIEIDFSAVDYMDSAALGMLLLLNERAAGKKITLVNCKGTVKSVLDIANFGKIFEIR